MAPKRKASSAAAASKTTAKSTRSKRVKSVEAEAADNVPSRAASDNELDHAGSDLPEDWSDTDSSAASTYSGDPYKDFMRRLPESIVTGDKEISKEKHPADNIELEVHMPLPRETPHCFH